MLRDDSLLTKASCNDPYFMKIEFSTSFLKYNCNITIPSTFAGNFTVPLQSITLKAL